MTSNTRFTLRSAVYLLPIKGEQVLLSRRFNTGWMDGFYSLISGHIDGNETVSDSMIREAFEEAGITINKNDLKPEKVIHRKSSDQEYMDFFFTTEKWSGEPTIMETDKCDDLSFFPMDKLPDNTLPYVRKIIEELDNGIAFIEYGWEENK